MRDFQDILDNLDLEVDEASIIPPPNNKSLCVFCSGDIIEDKQDRTFISEFYCSKCGLKYKFKPGVSNGTVVI